jgi:hypothetical protein
MQRIARMSLETGSKERTERGNWLEDTLRRFNFLNALREHQHVKRTCRECLQLYRKVEQDHATATAQERYARMVADRTGADAKGVSTIIQRAEESFASWPNERPLTLRDVVQYLAVTECLSDDLSASGVRADVTTLVAKLIPANL